jgi:hypothetical protein
MGEAKRRARAAARWPENLSRLHDAEEKVRAESVAFVEGQPDLRHHIAMTEVAMNGLVYFATKIEGSNQDEETIQLFSLRLFNAAASALKLALSGYGQNAAAAIRDILEVAFLLNHFAIWPDKIIEWRDASDRDRKKNFSPREIRDSLDKRDGFTEQKRKKAYEDFCRLATHPTPIGFALLRPGGTGPARYGPFFDEKLLSGVIEEMAKAMLQAGQIIPRFFPDRNDVETYSIRLFMLRAANEWLAEFYGAPRQVDAIAQLERALAALQSQKP